MVKVDLSDFETPASMKQVEDELTRMEYIQLAYRMRYEVMLNDSDPYALGEKYRRELTAIAQRHAERKRAIDDMRTHREGGE